MYAFFGKRYIYRMNSYNLASLLAEFLAPYASSASGIFLAFFSFYAPFLKRAPQPVASLCTGWNYVQRRSNVHDGDQIKTRFQGRAWSSRPAMATINGWTWLVDILRHSNYLPSVRIGIIRISMRCLPSVRRRRGWVLVIREKGLLLSEAGLIRD